MCVFFVRVTRSSLVLLITEYWLGKKLLKVLAYSLKSATELSWCSSRGMPEFFYYSERFLILTSMISVLFKDVTVYEIGECNIDS